MALFAISDLHLSLGTDKPMDVFGDCWKNYEQKLKDNWENNVTDDDYIILNGDNSWATYIQNAEEDFAFIHSLPGKKILCKGNHDYWWTTMNKQKVFCAEKGYDSIDFLHNNYFLYKNVAICGTRGWQITINDEEDQKIYTRELGRLEASIKMSLKDNPQDVVVALHYPPDDNFKEIIKKYDINKCVYGHLHAYAHKNAINGTIDGVDYRLVSCDFLNFMPLKIID